MQRTETHFPDRAEAVTPSDVETFVPSTIVVVAAGDVAVTPATGDTDITLSAVPAYVTIPFRVKAVKSTGTTATVIRVS